MIFEINLNSNNKVTMDAKIKTVRYLVMKVCIMIFFFLGISCSVQDNISKDDFKKIPSNFSAQFYDKLDSVGNYNNKVITRSLLTDFVDNNNINYAIPVKIAIVDNELFLSFKDVNEKQFVLKFYGKKYKSRFVFYTNYKTVSFPFILMSKEMQKYRIYLTNTNEIIFQKESENTGMLLFFGAGSSSVNDYQFKLLKNE